MQKVFSLFPPIVSLGIEAGSVAVSSKEIYCPCVRMCLHNCMRGCASPDLAVWMGFWRYGCAFVDMPARINPCGCVCSCFAQAASTQSQGLERLALPGRERSLDLPSTSKRPRPKPSGPGLAGDTTADSLGLSCEAHVASECLTVPICIRCRAVSVSGGREGELVKI